MNQAAQGSDPGAFAPLKHHVFRVLWIATVVGNIGTWVREMASGWAMTELSPSPPMIALVQALGTLPMFVLALPAGALTDLLDKRRLLIGVQVWLGLGGLALMLLAMTGHLDTIALLLLVTAGGIGTALMSPTWQAIVPEMIPRAELRAAVGLNTMGVNIARAIGPALGGLLLSIWGLAAAYALTTVTYVVTGLALLWWQREVKPPKGPPEQMLGAMRAGVRFAFASPELQRLLLRGAGFFLFGSGVWALLPLIALSQPGASAGLYGIMLGAIGAGAVTGALLLPRMRRRLSADALMRVATLLLSAAMLVFAFVHHAPIAILMCLATGVGWIVALTTLGATVQAVLPDWVRGRGLAIYLTVFYGALSLGSMLWGQVAGLTSLDVALAAAATGGVLAMFALWFARLPAGRADLTQVRPWPDPIVAQPVADSRGPVCILIEYHIDPSRRADFLAALRSFSGARRRNGAFDWQVYEDVALPGTVVEAFLESSWAEHQRHHERFTAADADLQAVVQSFHIGSTPPAVRHLLAG
jgi:predicted MFS family arabinose efflux permease